MEANELENGFFFFGVEIQPSEKGVGQFDAGGDVIAGSACLADVVEQESEQEEVEAVNLRQQLGESLFVFEGRLAERVDIVDDKEGVLVDGVAVIAVADHQGVDAVKLGDEHLQNAESVHGAESMSGVRPKEDCA